MTATEVISKFRLLCLLQEMPVDDKRNVFVE
ncbi:MAG: hypothetical protein A4E48_02728 [Methanosaeta sp. PtaU1.Bin060]|jgi:hypothetical protein|nr:MAG: hypothetical protein A4E48_02728 [Methanosaeta sp. PtaU1.Bin060]